MLDPLRAAAQSQRTTITPQNQRQFNISPQLRQTLNFIKTASNPQQAMQSIIMQNPNLSAALQYIQSHGGDSQKAFYQYVNELGLNPQTILNSIMQSGT